MNLSDSAPDRVEEAESGDHHIEGCSMTRPSFLQDDAGYRITAERVAAFVRCDGLPSQADIRSWQHNELRMP